MDETVTTAPPALTRTAPLRELERRKSFPEHRSCALAWARRHAEGYSGPLSFNDGTIFSYALPLARLVARVGSAAPVFALLSAYGGSMTTKTKHLPPTRSALHCDHVAEFTVDDIFADDAEAHAANRRGIERRIFGQLAKARRSRKYGTSYLTWVWSTLKESHAYAAAVGLGSPSEPVTFWGAETPALVLKSVCGSADYGVLPILADALQDAGFDDAEILGQLRGK